MPNLSEVNVDVLLTMDTQTDKDTKILSNNVYYNFKTVIRHHRNVETCIVAAYRGD